LELHISSYFFTQSYLCSQRNRAGVGLRAGDRAGVGQARRKEGPEEKGARIFACLVLGIDNLFFDHHHIHSIS
jgi:hypothetical protein